MTKKKIKTQCLLGFVAIGLLCTASLAMQVEGETERSFAPAKQDAKGRYINLDDNLPEVSITVRVPFFARRVLTAFNSRDGVP
ncbi:MAG: hypothetical protein ACPHLL_06405, partial [Porticoccaceae bacterium]